MEKRSNKWEIILYPESLPEWWLDMLRDTHCPMILSPLHQFDKYNKYDEVKAQSQIKKLLEDNPEKISDIERLQLVKEGTNKKPHYHLLIDFGEGANKSVKQIQEDFIIPLNAKWFPNYIITWRGAVRYLIHLDNPDKFQYSLNDIKLLNGFETHDYFDISNREMDNLSLSIMEFIDTSDIYDYYTLERATRNYLPWHKYVLTHTMSLKPLLECRLASKIQGQNNEDFSFQVAQFIEKERYLKDKRKKYDDVEIDII